MSRLEQEKKIISNNYDSLWNYLRSGVRKLEDLQKQPQFNPNLQQKLEAFKALQFEIVSTQRFTLDNVREFHNRAMALADGKLITENPALFIEIPQQVDESMLAKTKNLSPPAPFVPPPEQPAPPEKHALPEQHWSIPLLTTLINYFVALIAKLNTESINPTQKTKAALGEIKRSETPQPTDDTQLESDKWAAKRM